MVLQKAADLAGTAAISLKVLGSAGVIRPYSPKKLAQLAKTLKQWGPGPAGGFMSLAVRAPDRVGLVDELGELTFGEMDARSSSLAHALREMGVQEGDGVAVMCRNHRGFVEATIAASKLGADILMLNTAFSGPQLVEVLERDQPTVLVHDEEFTELVTEAEVEHRVLAWTDSDEAPDDIETLEQLIERHDPVDLDPPERHAKIVILTSGTTGTPKGAPRGEAGIEAAVSLLSGMPLRYGWRTHIAAPLFHTWGFGHFALSMLLGSTMVLKRKFDPEECLEVLEKERCDSLVVIPVMLQRILALPDERLDQYDPARLKVVASSGSALPGDLATTWMDRFGDNLYSTYGSTEVAYAAIAGPQELRTSPSTAGKPPYATVVKILDDDDQEVEPGTSGRIFVGNGLLFEGYTGGGSKDVVDGLMSSGDVGKFGEDGLLYVEGRDDEMIVSGGENVFPQEVEDCLARHKAVDEVAAIGVDDDDYGKRLRAFVVRSDSSVDEDTLKAWVKDNLARYKVPRDIVFLDELPRNATGKVLKKDLAEHDADDADKTSPGSERGAPGACGGRARSRLLAARPVRPGRRALILPRPQGGGPGVLPVRVLGHLHRRDVGHPGPARPVPHLRLRGARDLLRRRVLPACVLRRRRAQLPVAERLLAARRGDPLLRRLRRAGGVRDPRLLRHRPRRPRAVGGAQCSARRPRPRRAPREAPGRCLDRWRDAHQVFLVPLAPQGCACNVCPVEPLVTRDASGSLIFPDLAACAAVDLARSRGSALARLAPHQRQGTLGGPRADQAR